MKTLLGQAADALWDKYWDEMRQEWFKLEVLQDYSPEDDGPSLREWTRGEKQKSIQLMEEETDPDEVEDYRKKQKQGVKLTRIRVLKVPYSPYTEWELEYYKRVNILKYGDMVHLVDASKLADLELPAGDLMIFDSKRAAVNTYDHNGLVTHQTFYDESDDISRFLKLKKELIERAEKL
jgi:hypothetical protein